MVIYIDILLALNWWIDYLLLLAVRRASGGMGRSWRLALGALVGAASCFTLFLPPLSMPLMLLIRLLAAVLTVTVAFGCRSRRGWIRRILLLFVYSTALAGLCGALYFFAAPQGFYVFNGVVYYAVPPLLLVGLTVVCYGILWLWEQVSRRRAPAAHVWRLKLKVDSQQTEFTCLYDSGNHLVEPFSGRPVLVVERSVAAAVGRVPPSVENVSVEDGWRLIPYDTLGGHGLLPAFVPDSVTVGACELPPCYVAVTDGLGRGEYQGLLGSEVGEYLARKGDKQKCFTG